MCRHVPFVASPPLRFGRFQPTPASPPAPEVLRVTSTADDGGEGSLRWAIERNNAAPGRLRIELDPAARRRM